MAAARGFTDRLCACADHKDQDCYKKVQDDMQQWTAKYADRFKDYRPTEDEQKQSVDIAQRMSGCMQQLMQ